MRCLVTGGAGFIGGHLVNRLIGFGHEVVSIDNESGTSNDKFYWNPKSLKVKSDICDYKKIEPLFEGVDFVFHLAAQARIQCGIDNPSSTVMSNAVGTVNVLEASRQHGVKKVVYASTSSCYGLKNTPPLREDMLTDCLTPYSVSKVCGEGLCRTYYMLHGLKTISLRYFNVYGERQPTQGQYATVVGLFLKQYQNKEPMTIVGDGTQRRDFTHIKDVVSATVMAADCDNEDAFGEVYNIGSGSSHSIMELSKMIGSDRVHIPERKGEARETLADISKAHAHFGWEPQSNLIAWVKTQVAFLSGNIINIRDLNKGRRK